MNKKTILAPVLVLLTACGGGGEADAEKPITSDDPISTSKITSNEDFEFKTAWSMDVNINMSRTSNDMISVCNTFKDNGDGTYDIDYFSCSIKGTLDNNGRYSSKINITNDIESLVGVLWPKRKGDPALYQKFDITNGQETLDWNN